MIGVEPNSSEPNPEGEHHLEDKRVPCPICQEPIVIGAKKCIHCKSDLRGLQKYVSFSTPTLALITAMISVIASSLPAFHALFAPADAQMHLTFIGGGDRPPYREEVLLASNDGAKSGALTAARLSTRWTLKNQSHGAEFALLLPNGRPVIVAPGSSIGVVLTVDPIYERAPDTSEDDVKAFAESAKEANWKAEPLRSMYCQLGGDLVYSHGNMYATDLPIRCESVLLAIISSFVNRGGPTRPQ